MKLSDICDVYSGYAFKTFNDLGHGVPVIKISNLLTDGSIDLINCLFTTENIKDKFYSKKSDIYIALSGATTGKISIMDKDDTFAINQRVGIVRNRSTIPNEYLKYFLMSKSNRILEEASGCAQPNISPKQIANYDVPKCSGAEMNEIVSELRKIDKIKNTYQKQLELLDELVRARFVEMFGEIEDCDKWKSKIWNEVVTIQNGRDYKKVLVSDGGYPVVGTGGEIARSSGYLCPENTIVVGRKGSINNPMLMREKFWNVDTAFGVIPNSDYLHYQYFYYFCKFYNFMKLNKATTLPSTTKADLLKIRINIPPLELQNQFASFVEEIDKSRLLSNHSLFLLKSITFNH